MFLLPTKLCKEIEVLMNKFWWLSDVDKSKGIRWMSWNNMCFPKKHGGIGFKRIQQFNLAMLGKQARRILTEPYSFIARLLKARYFLRCNFGETRLGNNPSYVWGSIMVSQHLVCNGSFRRIGKGKTINIWKDPWIPNVSHSKISTPVAYGLENAKVCSLMVSDKMESDLIF